MSKTQIVGKNVDLERLSTRIENYLTENKFEVGFARDVSGASQTFLIQARKAGLLRTASGSRRSTNIKIAGVPNNFEIDIGTGEWGKNLVTSAPLFVIPVVGIAATITKLYTAKKFEDNLQSYIKDQTKHLENSYEKDRLAHVREYPCDYVEGHPEWNKSVSGSSFILERQKDNNCLILKLDEQRISIPANRIEKAEIITVTSKLEKPDRMIQIAYKDNKNKAIKLVLNFSDDVVRGVLAGIDELVSETKLGKLTPTIPS